MNVHIKFFATFRKHLPSGSQGNACNVEAPPGTRVIDLLAQYGVLADDSVVILVNGLSADPGQLLKDDDVVAIYPAMAGG
jgi:molybdopterin converting factor small subunit